MDDTQTSPSGGKSPGSIDLSSVPPFSPPAPPTNTLIITHLENPLIFLPEAQAQLRNHIECTAAVVYWAPLKSFRRVVAVFRTEEDAIRVRSAWDGESIMDHRIRIYFGEHTPEHSDDPHLHLPDAGKLFFISPPPSPPQGWASTMESPPNGQVLAADLSAALQKIQAKHADQGQSAKRSRNSSSITLMEPNESTVGCGIVVSDLSEDGAPSLPGNSSRSLVTDKVHTARPPVDA